MRRPFLKPVPLPLSLLRRQRLSSQIRLTKVIKKTRPQNVISKVTCCKLESVVIYSEQKSNKSSSTDFKSYGLSWCFYCPTFPLRILFWLINQFTSSERHPLEFYVLTSFDPLPDSQFRFTIEALKSYSFFIFGSNMNSQSLAQFLRSVKPELGLNLRLSNKELYVFRYYVCTCGYNNFSVYWLL